MINGFSRYICSGLTVYNTTNAQSQFGVHSNYIRSRLEKSEIMRRVDIRKLRVQSTFQEREISFTLIEDVLL